MSQPPLPAAKIASLAIFVANANSCRMAIILDQSEIVKALAVASSRALQCKVEAVELVLTFLCKARRELGERLRRKEPGTLKITSEGGELRWAAELLPLVRKRTQVVRYSPPKAKRTSPEKTNIKAQQRAPRSVLGRTRAAKARVDNKRDEQPRTAEEERSFGAYWKQVAPTLMFPKLLPR